MLLATTSVLVALASVASQVTAQFVRATPDIVSPKPFPARVQADSAFKIKINFPTDTRTAAEKAASPPADLTSSFYQTTGCLKAENAANDAPCIASWQASEPVSNHLDVTELRADVPATSDKLVVGGRYFISYFSGCTIGDQWDGCELSQSCRPCAGNFAGLDLKTDAFEVVAKDAEDDVPDSEELPSDSAAGMTTAVSSMAAVLVAGAMAIVA